LRFLPGVGGSVESIPQAHRTSHIAEAPVDKKLLHSFPHVDAMVNEMTGNNSAVLIHDVESVENPQQRLTSLARIDLADRFYDFFPEGLYWSEGFGFRHLGVVIDGELDSSPLVERISSGNKEKLVGQMIQGSSRCVNNLPYQGMSKRSDVAQFGYVKFGISRLLVKLGNDFVCAVFRPIPHLDFEITALFLGPFNATDGQSQGVRHDGSILREIKGYLPIAITLIDRGSDAMGSPMKEITQNGIISGFPDPAARVVRKGSNFESRLCGLSPPCFASTSKGQRLYLVERAGSQSQ
jgi:hypothetical protein